MNNDINFFSFSFLFLQIKKKTNRKTAQIHNGPVDEQPGAVVHQPAVGRLQEFRQFHRSASVGAASVAA